MLQFYKDTLLLHIDPSWQEDRYKSYGKIFGLNGISLELANKDASALEKQEFSKLFAAGLTPYFARTTSAVRLAIGAADMLPVALIADIMVLVGLMIDTVLTAVVLGWNAVVGIPHLVSKHFCATTPLRLLKVIVLAALEGLCMSVLPYSVEVAGRLGIVATTISLAAAMDAAIVPILLLAATVFGLYDLLIKAPSQAAVHVAEQFRHSTIPAPATPARLDNAPGFTPGRAAHRDSAPGLAALAAVTATDSQHDDAGLEVKRAANGLRV